MWKDSGVTWKSAQFLIFTIVVVFFLHLYSRREHSCKARLVLGAHVRVNLNVASACPPEPSLPAFKVPRDDQTTNYVPLGSPLA